MRFGLFGLLTFGALAAGTPLNCTRPAEAAPGTVVLVELFTSEGCSSCPPADAVLRKLPAHVDGARVVLLAHHVDYWDQLGWPDPFASAAATDRQRAYAPLGGGTYTPQAVVDGRRELVGSRADALTREIREAAKLPHASVDITIGEAKGGVVPVTVRSGALPKDASADAEISIAVVQNDGRVQVARGENAGRTLDHDAIAREVRTLGSVGLGGATVNTSLRPPAPVLPAGDGSFTVVAFVQEKGSRKILGTAAVALKR